MILVTGATGNVGRELVSELDAKGAKFRVLVRDPARAAALPECAQRFTGELCEPATLTPAFDGADKLFLLTPDIGTDHTAHAVAAAQAAGVRHIVHLSSIRVLTDPLPAMGRWHHQREEIVRSSGIPATFLRPDGFMALAYNWLSTIREGGYVLDPLGPGRYAPTDTADVAAVAALALTEDGHQGKDYVLTGDEVLTIAEQVRILAEAADIEIEVKPTTPAEAARSQLPQGAPQALLDALTELYAVLRADTTGCCTDTIQRLLGRRPRTFADWCARNAGAFRPPPLDPAIVR